MLYTAHRLFLHTKYTGIILLIDIHLYRDNCPTLEYDIQGSVLTITHVNSGIILHESLDPFDAPPG